MKYLLLFAFLGVVWWIWSKRNASVGSDPSARRVPPAEKMVTCVHCGVHLPESEGVADGGRIYCSEAHRAAAKSAGG
jgi:uncharacterized protein